MFDRIKKFLQGPQRPVRTPTPDTNIKAHPVVINPTTKQKEMRHAARLHRLHLAIDQGGYHPDDHQAVKDEIVRRQNALIGHGHKAPVNADEAHALVKKLQGNRHGD